MLKHSFSASRGDTLIEVLFAITTFSLAVVACLAVMNQGTSASVRSLQITLARQEVDSQAEALRFLNSSYVSAYYAGYAPDLTDAATSPTEEYYKIIQTVTATSVSKFGGDDPTKCPTAPTSSFIVNTQLARFVPYSPVQFVEPDSYSRALYDSSGVLTSSQGIWIEAAKGTPAPGKPRYIDFHVRACWPTVGSNIPMNIGTIVRLYEPGA